MAHRALGDAQQAGVDARAQGAAAMARPGSAAEQQWHRSWILRLDRERAGAAAVLAAREAGVAEAAAVHARTNQRVESLVRFKEKSFRAWERHSLAEERKFIDALATMRFVAASRSQAIE